MTVSQKHKEALQAAWSRYQDACVRLGDADLAVARAEVQRAQLRQQAQAALEERDANVRAAALALDIDIDGEDWTFNPMTGQFLRGRVGITAPVPAPAPAPPAAAEKADSEQ